MDNTNIKDLSEFEEYKKIINESAKVDDTLNGLLPECVDFDSGDEKIKHVIKISANILMPFTKTLGYITSYRLNVLFGQKLYEANMLNELHSLTYEEFYDRIDMLPKFLVRKIIGELNCSTSIFEELLLLINNQNRLEAIELMRNNNLDISLLSKKLILATKHHIIQIEREKVNNGGMKQEEYIQNLEEAIASETIDLKKSETELIKLKEWFLGDFLPGVLEVKDKIESATNDTEVVTIYKEGLRKLLPFPDKVMPILYFYWDNEDMLTIFERKVLSEILMRDPDFYHKARKNYEDDYNFEPLEHPLGIFEEELTEIYNKLERFCPRGQNFTALFGYGKLSPIIWTGDWNALSYFLRVLYSGSLENGKITFKQSVPTNMWENARKLFVDKKNNHPQLSSLKNRTISDLQKKDFAKEINYIFKNVFENIVTRKS